MPTIEWDLGGVVALLAGFGAFGAWLAQRIRMKLAPVYGAVMALPDLFDMVHRLDERSAFQDHALRAQMDNADHGIVWTEGRGRVVWVNRTYELMTGRDLDYVAGEGWKGIVAENDRPRVEAAWASAVAEGRNLDMEWDMIDANGHPFRVKSICTRISQGGRPLGWVATIHPIPGGAAA